MLIWTGDDGRSDEEPDDHEAEPDDVDPFVEERIDATLDERAWPPEHQPGPAIACEGCMVLLDVSLQVSERRRACRGEEPTWPSRSRA